MPKRHSDPSSSELVDSVYFWLSVLRCARRGNDAFLEGIARRRLTALGARVIFDSEYRPSEQQSEGGQQ